MPQLNLFERIHAVLREHGVPDAKKVASQIRDKVRPPRRGRKKMLFIHHSQGPKNATPKPLGPYKRIWYDEDQLYGEAADGHAVRVGTQKKGEVLLASGELIYDIVIYAKFVSSRR